MLDRYAGGARGSLQDPCQSSSVEWFDDMTYAICMTHTMMHLILVYLGLLAIIVPCHRSCQVGSVVPRKGHFAAPSKHRAKSTKSHTYPFGTSVATDAARPQGTSAQEPHRKR